MKQPQTKSAASEEDATVTVSGVEIACRISLPAGPALARLLLLPGSLYSDVDGNYPSMNMRPHAYADLARQMASRGFAVVRMAKIGPGTGSRTIDAEAAAAHGDFRMRVAVAEAGLDLLLRSADQGPVIVAGHSEGAKVANLLAQGSTSGRIDGVVSLSGAAEHLLDLLRHQVSGMAPPGVPAELGIFDRTVAAIRTGAALPPEASTNSFSAMLASMPEAAHRYLRSVDAIDPLAEIARVPQPVLIVHGGRDESVPFAHAERLRAARGSLPTGTAFFPSLTHFYKQAADGLLPMQIMALETESDPAVADAIVAWVAGLSG
ncbi:alpha/beta hydrolase family protein [Blastomonas natatoria]|uniref:Alpha/beta hydrolase family protein n=1 Tax=Blastomonas natatoria TaxID=34015 RepID=A0A2V3VE96_9SPHN|nr:alpha/beta fold hydrolase [Blastomonas natatoria]PXW79098.1 alpha/beta hydrolase family protein [Blastomonas natatoria]